MRTTQFLGLFVAVMTVALTVASCRKSTNPVPSPEPDPTTSDTVELCVTGDFCDFGTKAQVENTFRMTWTDGESVKVYGYSKYSVDYCGKLTAHVVGGTGNRVADLKGTLSIPAYVSKLYFIVCDPSGTVSKSSSTIYVDLKKQKGKADDVAFVAYSTVDYKGTESLTYRTTFSFATSILRVNVSNLTPDMTLTKACLGKIETKCAIYIKESGPSISGGNIDTIQRTFTDCSSDAKGNAAFYISIPKISENAERKLTVWQEGNDIYDFAGFATNAAEHSQMLNAIGAMNAEPYDLSANGTANCYIVPGMGHYKFKATVKGNSTKSVGTPTSAEVLWESFGTAVKPNIGDLIRNISLSDGYVKFTAMGEKGNAVIAVKNGNTILWSWHIWLTDAPSLHVYNNNAGVLMDRNLGATSATKGDVHALGLLYQWGRKDPFLSGESILSSTPAASTLSTWTLKGAKCNVYNYEINLDTSIANPTSYIVESTAPRDWFGWEDYQNDTLWISSNGGKTMYDPCPVGWRVPYDVGEKITVWEKAFGQLGFDDGPWDKINKGMDFGSANGLDKNKQLSSSPVVWFPSAGVISGGKLDYVGDGKAHCYHSRCGSMYYGWKIIEGRARYYVSVTSSPYRETACSVRCMQE